MDKLYRPKIEENIPLYRHGVEMNIPDPVKLQFYVFGVCSCYLWRLSLVVEGDNGGVMMS